MKSFYLFVVAFTVTISTLFAQPVNDDCSGAIEFPLPGREQRCIGDAAIGDPYNETLSGTTVGATPTANFPRCGENETDVPPTGDVWFRFIAAGSSHDITVNNSSFTRLSINVYEGPDCDLQSRGCVVQDGSAATVRVFSDPGDTMYVLVAGYMLPDGPNEGTFDINVETETQCRLCIRDDDGSIDLVPRNEAGTYACESTVNVCFTLDRYIGNQGAGNFEWLHSIVMDFGPGWDVNSLVPTRIPSSCNGEGTWGYYPNGWTSCETGISFPRGFAYESDEGTNCGTDNPNDPGDNWGDGAGGINYGPGGTCQNRTGPTVWCWDIDVKDCEDTFTGEDLGIAVTVFSDGISGSWTNNPCDTISFNSIGTVVICNDDEPIAEPTAQSCPELPDGSVRILPDGGDDVNRPFNYTIRNSLGNKVAECINCTTPPTFTDLPAGQYNAETINLANSCPQNTNFVIEPGGSPMTSFSYPPSCPADGAIRLDATPVSGTAVEYQWTGPNGFSQTTTAPFVLTADPADEGEYNLVVVTDGCTSPVFTLEVVYEPIPVVTAFATTFCIGDAIILQSTGSGPFVWYENGEPIPGENGAGINIEASEDVAGTVTYSVEALNSVCPGPVDIELTIIPFADPLIEYSPGQTVCFGEDLTLQALRQDGSAFPAGWTYDWANGSSNTSSNFVAGGQAAGNYTIELDLRSPEGCFTTVEVPYTVAESPEAAIIPANAVICADGGLVELCATTSSGTEPFSFVWSHDADLNVPCVQIDAAAAAGGDITATVTDATGCSTVTEPATVTVLDPPAAPALLSCDDSTPGAITFTWSSGGETYADVYVTVNGEPEILAEDNWTDLSYTVTNLEPGDQVQIRVVPFSAADGTECIGQELVESCGLIDCANPGWAITSPETVCLIDDPQNVSITLTTVDDGTVSFTSTDLGITGLAADPGGTTVLEFPALPPGQNTGSYSITAVHVTTDGNCRSDTTFSVVVTSLPRAEITASATEVCRDGEVTFSYDGDVSGQIFIWELPAGATLVSGTLDGPGPLTVAFTEPGSQNLSLELVNDCGLDIDMATVDVLAAPAPPVIECGPAGVLSVNFVWNEQAGVEEYEVSIDGGVPFRQTETSFAVDMLTDGQEVSITVLAIGGGTCGNSEPATATCPAALCPTFAADFGSLVDTICLETGTETIDLSGITVEGGSGTDATLTFMGPGVTGTTFDAAAAGGSETGTTHTVTLTYEEEGPCTFTTTFPLTVFVRPSVFLIAPDVACEGDTISITVGSTNFGMGQSIELDTDGGTLVPDDDPNDNSFRVFWPEPGDRTIIATVISNISGCPSEPATREITFAAPLTAPALTCGPSTSESSTFTWAEVVGATGYLLTMEDGTTTELPATAREFTVTGLTPGESPTLALQALSDGPCGDGPVSTLTCTSADCPPLDLAPAAAQTSFCLNEAGAVELMIGANEEGGVVDWRGPGVAMQEGVFVFIPATAGPGSHELTVEYVVDGLCTYTDALVMQVSQLAAVEIELDAEVVCRGDAFPLDVSAFTDLIGDLDITLELGDAEGEFLSPGVLTVTFPELGSYDLSVVLADGDCRTTVRQSVTAQESASAGTPLGDPLLFCTSNNQVLSLAAQLVNADAGGSWTTVDSNLPPQTLDPQTGDLQLGFADGEYRFRYRIGGGTCPIDSADVLVTVLAPPSADAGPDQTLTCQNGMLTLDASGSVGAGEVVEWSTDNPNAPIMDPSAVAIDISVPATYTLTVTNAAGCSATDEVVVAASVDAPVMQVQISNVSCFAAADGAIFVTAIDGGQEPFRFTLNGEDRGENTLFSGLEAQEYNLQITDANGCFSNIILDLTEPDELTIELRFPNDTTEVDFGDELFITASVNGGNGIDTLIWEPDSLRQGPDGGNGIQFVATDTRTISVTVVDALGCTATDQEMLIVRKRRPVYFPSAFSPNQDGNNDVFFVGADADVVTSLQDFQIYTRWGEMVFTSNDLEGITSGPVPGLFPPNDPFFGWNGTHRGKELSGQVLVYSVRANFIDGESVVYKGDFVLVR